MWSLAGLAVRMTAIYFGQAVFVVTLKTTTVPLMMVFCLETVDMLAAPSWWLPTTIQGMLHTPRVEIEKTFGRWKRRFHVLHSEIRMTPEKACLITGACAVLHNIAVLMKEPMEDGEEIEEVEVEPFNGLQQGLVIRDHICHTFFGWNSDLLKRLSA